MAAIVVGQRAAQFAAVASLVDLRCHGGLSLTNGWLALSQRPARGALPARATEATFTMLVNILGLLLVAFLASNLAGRLRLTGGRLREAAAHAAELSRLNEDILRSLSSGLITTNRHGTVRTVNPAGLEIFHAHIEAMLGRPDRRVLPRRARAGWRPCALGGQRPRPDGSTFPVGFSRTPLVNARGESDGRVVSVSGPDRAEGAAPHRRARRAPGGAGTARGRTRARDPQSAQLDLRLGAAGARGQRARRRGQEAARHRAARGRPPERPGQHDAASRKTARSLARAHRLGFADPRGHRRRAARPEERGDAHRREHTGRRGRGRGWTAIRSGR